MALDANTEKIRNKKTKVGLTRGRRPGRTCSGAKKTQVETNQGRKKKMGKSKQKKSHTKTKDRLLTHYSYY